MGLTRVVAPSAALALAGSTRLPVTLARSARALLLALAAAALAAAPAAVHTQPRPERPVPSDTTATAQAHTPEYTILIYESDAQLAARTSPTGADAYWDAYDRFAGELARAGVLRGGSALDERVRATVRGTGSADRAVRRARLGGSFVIAVRDRAAAEAWARKAPPRALAVELRPHRPNPHMAAMAAARRRRAGRAFSRPPRRAAPPDAARGAACAR